MVTRTVCPSRTTRTTVHRCCDMGSVTHTRIATTSRLGSHPARQPPAQTADVGNVRRTISGMHVVIKELHATRVLRSIVRPLHTTTTDHVVIVYRCDAQWVMNVANRSSTRIHTRSGPDSIHDASGSSYMGPRQATLVVYTSHQHGYPCDPAASSDGGPAASLSSTHKPPSPTAHGRSPVVGDHKCHDKVRRCDRHRPRRRSHHARGPT